MNTYHIQYKDVFYKEKYPGRAMAVYRKMPENIPGYVYILPCVNATD
jgi:hypothetical protein